MSMKKFLAVSGFVVLLGAGFLVAQNQTQAKGKNQDQNKVQVMAKPQMQNRLMFRDENGDGICDGFRDHDHDGIPNGQDPEWSRPQDGKGNENRFGGKNSGNRNSEKKEFRGGNTWDKQSFRQNRSGQGNGLCDQSFHKGNSRRGGNK